MITLDLPFVPQLRHRKKIRGTEKLNRKEENETCMDVQQSLTTHVIMIIRIYVYFTQLQSCSWDEWFPQNKNSCGEIFSNSNITIKPVKLNDVP